MNEGIEPIRLNLMTSKEFQKSGILYVVMDEERTTVLQMPGLNKPFSTKKRKYAELVAKEMKGVAVPFREAVQLVASSPCNLPKDSKFYCPDKRAPKIRMSQGRG